MTLFCMKLIDFKVKLSSKITLFYFGAKNSRILIFESQKFAVFLPKINWFSGKIEILEL